MRSRLIVALFAAFALASCTENPTRDPITGSFHVLRDTVTGRDYLYTNDQRGYLIEVKTPSVAAKPEAEKH